MTPEITESITFQCRHIFTDGRRCGSPALRSPEGPASFCYYHHNSRRPIHDAPTRRRRQSRFTLPNPEDRSAIQQSIGEVLRRIASNDIDPRRAGLLLYGLQIASLNLPKSHPREEPAELVSEVTHDPEHGLLAPPAELHANEPKSSAQRLLEELDSSYLDEKEPHQPTVDLQAAASGEPTPGSQPRSSRGTHRSPARATRETMYGMSNFIPKPASPKQSGLGPKAQKLAALREKAAAQANTTSATAATGTTSAAKPKNSFAGKKTAFQRKAT